MAGRGANDILSSVFSGTYTFEPGACEKIPLRPAAPLSDAKPPWIENLRPGIDWGNMVPNTNLSFTILDNLSGVDLSSLKIEIDNILYTKDGGNVFNYEGTPRKYKITVDPEKDFIKNEGEKIPVTISARDLAQNLFTLDYTFTVYPISECLDVRPAAPVIKYSTGARNMILILLILIIVLFTTNVWLVTEPPIREKTAVKPKRKKKRIKKSLTKKQKNKM